MPDAIVFASNTHDFLIRLVAAAPRRRRTAAGADQRRRVPQRAAPVRALGGGAAGSRSSRSPPSRSTASPSASSSAARSGEHDLILVSQVLFGSGRIFDRVEELAALGRPEGPWVVIDGYHAFMALDAPVRRGGRDDPLSTSAAATNMRWRARAAPSCMRPPGFGAAAAGHRLVRRVRGSEPAAGTASATPRTRCASWARPSIRRRSTASTPCSGCWPRTA